MKELLGPKKKKKKGQGTYNTLHFVSTILKSISLEEFPNTDKENISW